MNKSKTTIKYDNNGKVQEENKPLGRRPKARVCYICGRMYMVHSFAIHETQCRDLFNARENQKPPKERKVCPEDPLIQMRKNQSLLLQGANKELSQS